MTKETGAHVLVVDDDLDALESLRQVLSSYGIETVQAKDGIDAIACLYARKPLAVLLDLMMPRMSGFELIRQIRDDRRFHGIPIIALSAAVERFREAEEAGADVVYSKPVQVPALIAALKRIEARASS